MVPAEIPISMSSLYDVRVSMHEGSTSSSSKLASEFLAEREEQEAASTEQADHIDFSAGLPLHIELCKAKVMAFKSWVMQH